MYHPTNSFSRRRPCWLHSRGTKLGRILLDKWPPAMRCYFYSHPHLPGNVADHLANGGNCRSPVGNDDAEFWKKCPCSWQNRSLSVWSWDWISFEDGSGTICRNIHNVRWIGRVMFRWGIELEGSRILITIFWGSGNLLDRANSIVLLFYNASLFLIFVVDCLTVLILSSNKAFCLLQNQWA